MAVVRIGVCIALLAAVAVGVLRIQRQSVEYAWDLPTEMPPPNVPADNPMSDVKVTLGRWLFYDNRLSVNGTMSCASCHLQQLAFTDGKPHSIGSTEMHHPRSSMGLVNVAYSSRLTWANPLLDRLEDQALTPLFGDDPVEMGMNGHADDIANLLLVDERYKELTIVAFPNDEDPHSVLNAVRAISSFVRSINSFDSPYDHYLGGDSDAISPAAVRGMDLFFSERVECFHCHGGFNFTDSSTHSNSAIESVGFHNNGLYNLNGEGGYPSENTGLYDMTGVDRDMGRFKAPTLRNIAITGPYMHDGSLQTLQAVIDHYARGGRLIPDGPHAGDGRLSPFKSEFVAGFEITDQEQEDLIEFLQTLTDGSVLSNPNWSDPFQRQGEGDSAIH